MKYVLTILFLTLFASAYSQPFAHFAGLFGERKGIMFDAGYKFGKGLLQPQASIGLSDRFQRGGHVNFVTFKGGVLFANRFNFTAAIIQTRAVENRQLVIGRAASWGVDYNFKSWFDDARLNTGVEMINKNLYFRVGLRMNYNWKD
jgi:hypothetical protein